MDDRLGLVSSVLAGRDRMMAQVVATLVTLKDADGLHDRLGGMTLQVWLEHVCRLPGVDARALMGCVDVLARLPSVVAGLADGWLSWPQAAAICRAGRRVRVAKLAELDDLLAAAMPDAAGFEPAALVDDVWGWVDQLQPTRLERAEAAAERGQFVSLAPRLFGGGTVFADLDTVGFATVAEWLDNGPSVDTVGPDDDQSAPAATEPAGLADLANRSGSDDLDPDAISTPSDLDGLDEDQIGGLFDTLDERRRAGTRDQGADRARRLIDICAQALAGHTGRPTAVNPGHGNLGNGDGDGVGGGPCVRSSGDGARRARPLLVATIDAAALLDAERTPGWLLHTLTGGRMKVTAHLLRQLVDDRGTDLRTVVLDDCGQVVGVGRRTYVPPGWLREAIWARDLAVRDPVGACPVRRADLDHVEAWPAGPTDVDNLQPVGRTWHNHKTSKAWTVTRAGDGTMTWRHRRHGWTIRMAPTRRDLTDPPRDPANLTRSGTSPPGTDPPGTGLLVTAALSRQPRLAGVP